MKQPSPKLLEWAAKSLQPKADFVITGGPTTFVLTPQNEAAKEWLRTNTAEERGLAVVVERRYLRFTVNSLLRAQFTVSPHCDHITADKMTEAIRLAS